MVDKDGDVFCDVCDGYCQHKQNVYIKGMNICLSCAESIGKKAEAWKKVKKVKPIQKGSEPIVLDQGKLTALYNAGWSIKNIASDMNVSENTIRRNVRMMIHEGRLVER